MEGVTEHERPTRSDTCGPLRDGLQTPETASDHIIQEVDRLSGIVTDLDRLAETAQGELKLSL